MACVKVYLCSCPEDSVVERKFLRQNVFPKLRDHCRRTHGLDFRVIDPFEQLDCKNWPTLKVRLQLIEECRQSSLGPFFVGLVGGQYGSSCLPEQVNLSEFLKLLQTCEQMKLSCEVLEKSYKRDENTVPPSYRLLTQPEIQEDTLEKVRNILSYVVTRCVLDGDIDQEEAQKYFRSSLETDLRFALEGRSNADVRRCVFYINNSSKESEQKMKGNETQADFQTSWVRLKHLTDDFLPNLVQTHRALVYITSSECEAQPGYAEDLGQQVYSDLKKLIDRTVLRKQDQISGLFSQQRDPCCFFSSLYKIQREEVKHVRAYLEQDSKYPFILTGGPCAGKTVFLAHCAEQIKTWMEDQDPVVVVQFTDFNSSLKETLRIICHQLALSYNQPDDVYLKDIFALKKTFNNLLTTSSLSSKHLILILDGLDRMPNTTGSLDLTWLPKTLPSNVKLIISSTPLRSGFLSAIKAYYPESPLFFELKPLDSKTCNQMLKNLLLTNHRRITSGQQMFVNQVFKKCSLPLFVELLYRQANSWSSDFEMTKDTLVPGVHANIGRFLDHLEGKHGKVIVSRTLEYLTLSRHGLTESELVDILSCDDEVLSTFLTFEDAVPYKFRVPEVAVERLLLDLEGFLMVRNYLGCKTLSWISRHFNLVIHKRYSSSNEEDKRRSLMANYFSGRWACGTAKPLIVNASLSIQTPVQNDLEKKIYTDRLVPGQPWMFQPFTFSLASSGSSGNVYPNLRKLHELPFHLMQNGSFEELGQIMLSKEFFHAMFQANLTEELVFWLEKASQKIFPRELRLLANILKTSFIWLKDSIADRELILQAKLIPFINVFPALEKFVKLERHDGTTRSTGMTTILCPTPHVPATHWVPPEVSPITKAAVSQCGSVVVIQDSGSAWVWNGSDSEDFKLSHFSELHFTDVVSSANVFLLSTQCGKLLLWDTDVPSHLQEVQTQHIEQDEKNIFPVDGILMCNGNIFAFSKGMSSVRVFEEGVEVTPLQCSSGVTCMSCPGDGNGFKICCGQKEGVVSIFDSLTGHRLTTFICLTGMPVFDLIFHDHGETVTCVDCTGSVSTWDLTSTNPILIKEHLSCTKEEVLNIDHSESNLLLICKRQQIQILDEELVDIEGPFNAPRGKMFLEAILDPQAHYIIALMKDPFLLVWNLVSGQCVLSVDTGGTQAFKLSKLQDFPYLTAVTSSGVVNWDVDVISVAASTPKSGRKVVKVVVEPDGEHFYTADDSEQVWRWTVFDGKPEGVLLHDGPVETMVLSVDGVHLVTIASGDIYVWNTSTNKNIHRIFGSQASQILLTSNGNCAVSLSETGLSRIWKLCSGHVVCSIYHHLRDAVISPESTFLLGINKGDLLAVSLWSGYVCKRFSSSEWSKVVAFHPLSDHPDYVIVLTVSGALYSWRLTEETVCHQFQFPESFQHLHSVKFSSDGSYAIISVDKSKINILDVYNGELCSLNTEDPLCQPFIDICGKYAVYICDPGLCHNYASDLHNKQILVVIRVNDGKKVGKSYLCKSPSALALSEELCVYVGFQDGSVGVYAFNDMDGYTNSRPKCKNTGLTCPFDEPEVWSPLSKPDLSWVEVASE